MPLKPFNPDIIRHYVYTHWGELQDRAMSYRPCWPKIDHEAGMTEVQLRGNFNHSSSRLNRASLVGMFFVKDDKDWPSSKTVPVHIGLPGPIFDEVRFRTFIEGQIPFCIPKP